MKSPNEPIHELAEKLFIHIVNQPDPDGYNLQLTLQQTQRCIDECYRLATAFHHERIRRENLEGKNVGKINKSAVK